MGRPNVDRVILIVMDSVGIGALPDADEYGDAGSDTLRNTAKAVGGLDLPFLGRLGLGNIAETFGEPLAGVPAVPDPLAAYGRMSEESAGKDTTTGHWEIAGIVLDRPFPVYPHGFPPEVIYAFERAIGTKVLGNKPASGTEIIRELGEEHMTTGFPIVYTSADSVFQVAAHEDVIPVERLYEMCRKARSILVGEHGVGRVIARPFEGTPGTFARTRRRKDFSIKPPRLTVLDHVKRAGMDVVGVGKIEDIFAFQGLTKSDHTANNEDTMRAVIRLARTRGRGLIFANCIDFDMLWGHRNDVRGYARALAELDRMMEELAGVLNEGDVLMITADHGCDPTTPSTDHSREYVPLLVYGSAIRPGAFLGTRGSFADLGRTVADLLGVPAEGIAGESFAATATRD
ncbi:MAG: phosphopentomutase [Firmicutes bacterium]|nr:phosphopentomutase [Bacillota bacterium]MDH7495734.1 phosphopentomutase [Bacillota bacterium]